jgi:2,5-diketo-D-gluconate reductase B
MVATFEALMSSRECRLTRAIGVCNFNLPMLRRAVEEIGAPIAGLQVEYHPVLSQAPMLSYIRGKGIPLTAYAPLAQGRAADDATLASLGRKHGCSAAQLAVAWLLDQEGVIVIPKAARAESQKANLAALRIRLDDEDRAAIAALPKDLRFVRPPFAPKWDAAA